MRKIFFVFLSFFVTAIFAQTFGDKVLFHDPPYPRLGIRTWYTPVDFASELRKKTCGAVTIRDSRATALIDFLSAHQYVEVVAGSYLGDTSRFATNRNRLSQAKAQAGFYLLGIFGSSGVEPWYLTFTNAGPNSPWPFVPEWFVQEVVLPLPSAVHKGDTVLPIDSRDLDVYCLKRDTGYENDQVIIMDRDPGKREAVILKSSTWDRSSNYIHLTTHPALRSPYDFGMFKFDHDAGTPVRLNVWHDWGNWWGYNMTDVGPVAPPGSPYAGLRWNQYRPRVIYNLFKKIRDRQGRLLFDGLVLDTFNQVWFTQYSSRPQIVKRLDLDADGVPDWEEQNKGIPGHDPTGCYPDYWSGKPNWDNGVWAVGHTTFTKNLRALWDADPELNPNHAILVQHEFGRNAAYMNGQSFEGIPNLELSPETHANRWKTAFEHYQYWENTGRLPRICFIFTNCPKPRDSSASYKQMRLALAFTLMGSGYFWHSPYYPGTGFNGDSLWWFDEYAVDNSGRAIDVYVRPAPHPLVNINVRLLEEGRFANTVRPGLGYLGHPVSKATIVANGVYRRDFERGIVLANFTDSTVKLQLERKYRKIRGIQDPKTNDGSLVSSVDLPAMDAIILLKQDILQVSDRQTNVSH